MFLSWLNASEAAEFGTRLAERISLRGAADPGAVIGGARDSQNAKAIQDLFHDADRELGAPRFNFYLRAKCANAFKWRLLEKGVDKALADDVTQRLLLRLCMPKGGSTTDSKHAATARGLPAENTAELLARGNRCMNEEKFTEAIDIYLKLIAVDRRHAVALNNLGAALYRMGRYQEAEQRFRQSIAVKPRYPDPYSNLATAARAMGNFSDAERLLRRALKLNPRHVDARINLGINFALLGRVRDAETQLREISDVAPRNADALFGLALAAKINGKFDAAGALLEESLALNPTMPRAWALYAGLRRMQPADSSWLARAELVAAGALAPLEAAELRFAIGKFHDDVGDYRRAFQSFQAANELIKGVAERYDRDARTQFVDGMIRTFTPERIARKPGRLSDSMKPVFLVGMPRSGTSLVEQIIASHPAARGAGELGFWDDAVREHGAAIRRAPFSVSMRERLAADYLRTLSSDAGGALRIVDKAPVNSDHLGVIHSVFPSARIIYLNRDPIDTCLSCYFQNFSPALNFSFDLSDLVHYYEEHRRLIAHWRAELPPGSILDVPYEELVADTPAWTRKILDYLGLEWDPRCLEFHATRRPVATASSWQVRQPIYGSSVRRWRHYEKYIGPLLKLRN